MKSSLIGNTFPEIVFTLTNHTFSRYIGFVNDCQAVYSFQVSNHLLSLDNLCLSITLNSRKLMYAQKIFSAALRLTVLSISLALQGNCFNMVLSNSIIILQYLQEECSIYHKTHKCISILIITFFRHAHCAFSIFFCFILPKQEASFKVIQNMLG